MAPTKRSIFGAPNPAENHLAPVGTSGLGGDTSLSARGTDAAPADGDQGSQDTLARRQAIAVGYVEAQRLAAGVSDAGAAGVQIGRGDDTLTISGSAEFDGGGVGDVIAPEGPVVTRDANLSQDGAPGVAIG